MEAHAWAQLDSEPVKRKSVAVVVAILADQQFSLNHDQVDQLRYYFSQSREIQKLLIANRSTSPEERLSRELLLVELIHKRPSAAQIADLKRVIERSVNLSQFKIEYSCLLNLISVEIQLTQFVNAMAHVKKAKVVQSGIELPCISQIDILVVRLLMAQGDVVGAHLCTKKMSHDLQELSQSTENATNREKLTRPISATFDADKLLKTSFYRLFEAYVTANEFNRAIILWQKIKERWFQDNIDEQALIFWRIVQKMNRDLIKDPSSESRVREFWQQFPLDDRKRAVEEEPNQN